MKTKRRVKRSYISGEIGLSEAMGLLIFDFNMDFTPASEYLIN